MGFAGLLAVALIGYLIFRSVYTSTSHSRLPQGSLDISAVPKIAGSKIVGLKGEKTYETTVVFDDGFEFISHRSNRADRFATYTISLTGEIRNKILADAVKAHTDAYVNEQKRNNNTIPEVVAFAFANVSEWEKYKNKYAKDLIVSWKWKDESVALVTGFCSFAAFFGKTKDWRNHENTIDTHQAQCPCR